MNSKEVNNRKGLVGLGMRELADTEMSQYCPNSKPLTPPNIPSSISNSSKSLTTNFNYLSFTSGCYYMDLSTGKWSSDGVEVQSDTSILYTHCKTNHLTTFAGGWVVLPSAINFDYVFTNASFEKNKTIYLTVIILFVIYILFAIWGRYMDRQDLLKIGVAPLIDNQASDNYFYEIILFTGARKDAGTDSKVRFLIQFKKFYLFSYLNKKKVRFILSGEKDETEIRILEDEKRKPFRRGGVDSFIMSNKTYVIYSLFNLSLI
jgi:hypothetical protein